MTRIVLDLSLDCHQFGCLHRICMKLLNTNALVVCLLSSLNCSQCLFSPVCLAFLWLLFRLLCILINSRDIHGRWDFALVLQCGMVLFISVVRLSRKKIQFVLTSCEFGSVSKYLSVILEISFLSLHQSADLYLNTL